MVMTPKDIDEYHNLESLKVFKSTGYDEFCVRFYHKTKELVFLVNGVERNRIKLKDPESNTSSKFDLGSPSNFTSMFWVFSDNSSSLEHEVVVTKKLIHKKMYRIFFIF